MKLSTGFWQTYKETPADAEIPSHRLMVRAGLIHKSGAGLYNYMPFALKSIQKVETIVREELNRIGSYEILMSVVTPGELWQESGRWDKMEEMLKVKDKAGRDICLSPTNEEAVVDIFKKYVKSYKNLPTSLYQINTKFRDEIRPRFGLMRGREFTMKDAYSFHIDKDSLDSVYDDFYKAYCAIFDRIGFEYSVVEADAGAMASSDQKTHEFQVIAETGEDEIIYCKETGYAANSEKAQTKRANLEFNTTGGDVTKVATPDKATIEEVCDFLKQPQHQSLKSLVYFGISGEEESPVLIQLLGDDELNEVKLKAFLKCDHVRAATDTELLNLGFEKGFIGPTTLKTEVPIVFDSAVELEAFYTVGAGEIDFHLENVSPKRDVTKYEQADLRLARSGDLTADGKGTVAVKRGIEVGHIFQLGNKYTESMDASVLDQNGKAVHPLMGCYGIGITRTVAAAIEQNHDDKGIIWPKAIAPSQIHFVAIAKSDEYKQIADDLYEELKKNNWDVVYDDRKAGPGFKFKDADLLGLPLQLVLGERDHKESGEFEIVIRKSGEKIKVKREGLLDELKAQWDKL